MENSGKSKFKLILLVLGLIIIAGTFTLYKIQNPSTEDLPHFKIVYRSPTSAFHYFETTLNTYNATTANEKKALIELYQLFQKKKVLETDWTKEMGKRTIGYWTSLEIHHNEKKHFLSLNTNGTKSPKIIGEVATILTKYKIPSKEFGE